MGRRMRSEAASIAVNARERQGFRATADPALVGIIIVASVAFVASEDFKAVAHGRRRCVGIHGQIHSHAFVTVRIRSELPLSYYICRFLHLSQAIFSESGPVDSFAPLVSSQAPPRR